MLLLRHHVPVVALLSFVACVSAHPSTGAAPTQPGRSDASAIIARHVALFGGPPTDDRPVSIRAAIHRRGADGEQTAAWNARRTITVTSFGGRTSADGVDDAGAWSLTADVFVRHRPDEIHGRDTFFWVLRRGYIDAIRRGEAKLESVPDGPKTILAAKFERTDLGRPVLRFDADTAALLDVTSADASGRITRVAFDRWTEAGRSKTRLPGRLTVQSPHGDETKIEIVEQGEIAPCPMAERQDPSCLSAPKPSFQLTWPAPEVHVPARFVLREVLLQTRIGKQAEATSWAFLDSGAGLSALDLTTARGAAFKPSGSITAVGVGETMKAGLGTLEEMTLGGLIAERLPVVAVPIPGLAVFGTLRPTSSSASRISSGQTFDSIT